MNKINYYNTYEDDFIETNNQHYQLKNNYKWIHKNIFYQLFLYYCIFFFLYQIYFTCHH